jgi:hypothetical protein
MASFHLRVFVEADIDCLVLLFRLPPKRRERETWGRTQMVQSQSMADFPF